MKSHSILVYRYARSWSGILKQAVAWCGYSIFTKTGTFSQKSDKT